MGVPSVAYALLDACTSKCNPGSPMPSPWSAEEVRFAIEDYFSMLREELQGADYNKTGHRKQLLPHLQGRNDGSVERKHQNISAVLIELGLPYIDGYKPLANYQRLLKQSIVEHIESHQDILRELSAMADLTAPEPPPLLDIGSTVVEPPEYLPGQIHAAAVPQIVRNFDFLGQDARNRQLGKNGEKFVLAFEEARLVKAGRKDLGKRIEWVSEKKGDGAGFDIASFDENGRERLIEVKTTNHGRSFPFLVSRNELTVSESTGNFWLYRVFGFHRSPRLFMMPGAIPLKMVLNGLSIQFWKRGMMSSGQDRYKGLGNPGVPK